MTRTVERRRGETGQVIILMVMTMTVMFIVGAIVVDVGLWITERRGAQADADFVALSGAWELLDPAAGEAEVLVAVNLARDANDEQLNLSIIGVDVNLDTRCVSVDVEHDSEPLFFGIFGVEAPDIGAHATACTGAANAPGNLVPFEIDNNPGPCFDEGEMPIFTSLCPIEVGAQGGNPRGMLDLSASGDFCSEASGGVSDLADIIENGAPGICLINETDDCDPDKNGGWYDCVAAQGGTPKKVLDGVAARLAKDGLCDGPDTGGWDDFDESVDLVFGAGVTGIYAPRDCDPSTDGTQASPRLVSLIVLEDPPDSSLNTGYPILAFAGFYIAGCANEDLEILDENSDGFDRYCDTSPAGDTGPPGKAVVYGRFVNIIYAGGDIGDPNDQTTAFGIALTE